MILQKASVTKALYETGAFAVVRVPTVERGCEIAAGLIRGGVHAMQIRSTHPNAGEVNAGSPPVPPDLPPLRPPARGPLQDPDALDAPHDLGRHQPG